MCVVLVYGHLNKKQYYTFNRIFYVEFRKYSVYFLCSIPLADPDPEKVGDQLPKKDTRWQNF